MGGNLDLKGNGSYLASLVYRNRLRVSRGCRRSGVRWWGAFYSRGRTTADHPALGRNGPHHRVVRVSSEQHPEDAVRVLAGVGKVGGPAEVNQDRAVGVVVFQALVSQLQPRHLNGQRPALLRLRIAIEDVLAQDQNAHFRSASIDGALQGQDGALIVASPEKDGPQPSVDIGIVGADCQRPLDVDSSNEELPLLQVGPADRQVGGGILDAQLVVDAGGAIEVLQGLIDQLAAAGGERVVAGKAAVVGPDQEIEIG